MRYIKQQTTNARGIIGRGIYVSAADNEVILDSTNVMLVPKGTTAQRPTFPNNGHLRYNTTANELEVYQDSAWRKMRFKEPNRNPGIVVQTLGVGDAVETIFGILNSGDPDYPIPAAAQNILVFVENVYQLPTTNYSLVQNPVGFDPGWYLEFASAVPLDKPVTVIHNFDK
jgi:hypothetical protein